MILPALRGYYDAIAGYSCAGRSDGVLPHLCVHWAPMTVLPPTTTCRPGRRTPHQSSLCGCFPAITFTSPSICPMSCRTSRPDSPKPPCGESEDNACEQTPHPPMRSRSSGWPAGFPAPNSVSAFWNNLRRGEESIATLSAEALAAAGYRRRRPRQSGVCPACAAPGRRRRVRRRLLRFLPAGRPDDRSATPAVPAVRLACAGGRGLRPRPVRRLDRRVRNAVPPVVISATTCSRTAIWTPSWARARTSI